MHFIVFGWQQHHLKFIMVCSDIREQIKAWLLCLALTYIFCTAAILHIALFNCLTLNPDKKKHLVCLLTISLQWTCLRWYNTGVQALSLMKQAGRGVIPGSWKLQRYRLYELIGFHSSCSCYSNAKIYSHISTSRWYQSVWKNRRPI